MEYALIGMDVKINSTFYLKKHNRTGKIVALKEESQGLMACIKLDVPVKNPPHWIKNGVLHDIHIHWLEPHLHTKNNLAILEALML